MAKPMTLGMIKLWEQMLDEATAPVMARVHIIEKRNEILAKFEVENELGITQLRGALAEAEAQVEKIKGALIKLGVAEVADYRRNVSQKAARNLESMIEKRAAAHHTPAVQKVIATIAAAKESVRLAMMPAEVRSILDEVKKATQEALPMIDASEKLTAKLLRDRKIEKADDED